MILTSSCTTWLWSRPDPSFPVEFLSFAYLKVYLLLMFALMSICWLAPQLNRLRVTPCCSSVSTLMQQQILTACTGAAPSSKARSGPPLNGSMWGRLISLSSKRVHLMDARMTMPSVPSGRPWVSAPRTLTTWWGPRKLLGSAGRAAKYAQSKPLGRCLVSDMACYVAIRIPGCR